MQKESFFSSYPLRSERPSLWGALPVIRQPFGPARSPTYPPLASPPILLSHDT